MLELFASFGINITLQGCVISNITNKCPFFGSTVTFEHTSTNIETEDIFILRLKFSSGCL